MNGDNNLVKLHLRQLNDQVVRVVYTVGTAEPESSALIAGHCFPEVEMKKKLYSLTDGFPTFRNSRGKIVLKENEHVLREKDIYCYEVQGKPVYRTKQTANGEVVYIENGVRIPSGTGYEGKLLFETREKDCLYGLGQQENGIFNYRGHREYLFQSNMKVSLPFLLSSENYGILIDTESSLIFESESRGITFTEDTVKELSYYFITGENFDEIISALRELTGKAPMLPRWAYGYIQSKERYFKGTYRYSRPIPQTGHPY